MLKLSIGGSFSDRGQVWLQLMLGLRTMASTAVATILKQLSYSDRNGMFAG